MHRLIGNAYSPPTPRHCLAGFVKIPKHRPGSSDSSGQSSPRSTLGENPGVKKCHMRNLENLEKCRDNWKISENFGKNWKN